MPTYYIRVKPKASQTTINRLWNDRLIAIHFPQYATKPTFRKRDNPSTDPADYPGITAMKRLAELADGGGYVCAEYQGQDSCLVGRVDPGSKIKLIKGEAKDGRKIILKALTLKRAKVLPAERSALVTLGRPQQGTLLRWTYAGNKIANIVEGRRERKSLDSLLTVQQEVMCGEFLRSDNAHLIGLPVISHFLTPVGRTMRDIDIYGITSTGSKVFAQVTFSRDADCGVKKKALLRYKDGEVNDLILFCNCKKLCHSDGIILVPIREVFTRFTENGTGKQWLLRSMAG